VRVLTVIVNYKTAPLCVKAIESVLPELAAWPGSRVVVVDNDSRDGSADVLAAAIAERSWSDRVTLIASPRNGGFGAGCNIGLQHGLGLAPPPDYFYLLNPDAIPDAGAVAALVGFMDGHPTAGIAGSHLYTPDGKPHSSAFRFPSLLGELDYGLRFGPVSRLLQRWVVAIPPSHDTFEVGWVAGASFMIRRETVRQIGLFDEGFFLYFEETDFCLRAQRHGWSVWYVGASTVGHIGGAATGIDHTDYGEKKGVPPRRRVPSYWFASRRRYFEKNHGLTYRAASDAVFVAGYALWRVRRRLLKRPDNDPPELLRDFLRHSLGQPPGSAIPAPRG
jgi:GT2 family glycosyltransferase